MVVMKDSKKTTKSSRLATALLAGLAMTAACDRRDAEPNPGLEVIMPQEESLVATPVYFELEAPDWNIEPPTSKRDGAGYFVLILEGGCRPAGQLMPFEPEYVHLADGGFSAWVPLSRGVYEVCAQIADGDHRATSATKLVKFEVVE